jgi:hypothetical protein
MEEENFLNNAAATVTSSRIVISGKTFATRNVGSVSVTVVPPNKALPIILIIIGVLCAFGTAWIAALVFAGIGGLWLYSVSATYKLFMMAGGGEVMALESKDAGLVKSIHDAVAQAIAVR